MRTPKTYSHNGETLTASEWAKRLGLSKHQMGVRLRTWDLDRALSTPRQDERAHDRRNKEIVYAGQRKIIADWARLKGVNANTLRYRIKAWGVHKALGN